MVYNESTNQLFVSNPLSDTISVIDCATDNVMATIPVLGSPDGIASYGNDIYVATLSFPALLYEIDATTNTTIAEAMVGNSAMGVAVNPQTQTLYTANYYPSTVSVVLSTPSPTAE